MSVSRPLLLSVAAATVAAGAVTAWAETTTAAPKECHALTDAATDSFLTVNGTKVDAVQEPTRDILSVDHALQADQVTTTVHLTAAEAIPSHAYSEVLTAGFKVGAHTVSVFGRRYAQGQLHDTAEPTVPLAGITVDGKALAETAVTASWDVTEKTATLSYPAPALAQALGLKTLKNAKATSLEAKYEVAGPAAAAPAAPAAAAFAGVSDTASGAAYTLGSCDVELPGDVGPVADLVLKNVGATTGQHSDVATVGVKVTDSAGEPVADRSVTFTLGTLKATAKTGTDGIARTGFRLNSKAGRYTLTATIASDEPAPAAPEEGTESPAPESEPASPAPESEPASPAPEEDAPKPAKLQTTFTIAVEKSVLKATGGRGTVTATLLDDDRHPIVNQPVVFTMGSKKTTVRTNSKGVATLTKQKPGTTVKVTYAGASGQFTAAATSAKA